MHNEGNLREVLFQIQLIVAFTGRSGYIQCKAVLAIVRIWNILMRLKNFINFSFIIPGLIFTKVTSLLAATTTGTVAVTATVLSACSISATPLPFGIYNSVSISGTATLTVICTVSTPYSVGLDAGTGTGSTTTTRKMTNGASVLSYQLFKDAAHTSNFGQTLGTDTSSGTGSGTGQTITIYGQILAGQNVAPGVYTDTVTATLTY